MTQIRIPYGKTTLTADIPDRYRVQTLTPNEAPAAPQPLEVVRAVLNQPQGGKTLADFKGAKTVAIAINDKTRPVPHQHLLPPLLEQLHEMSFQPEDISFVIATGTHDPMPPEEYAAILPPEIIEKYGANIISHNCDETDNLAYLGETERGTPVYANKRYMAADLHLAVGNAEPHQFMGFSGGVKSVAIGVAGRETINHNHSMMTHADAQLGEYALNPARQDIEEAGRMMRVDFVVNALLNGKKQIVDVLAGDPVAVMQAVVPRVREIFQVSVEQAFDLMIVSPGGHPKDINIYQAQKALGHAALVTKAGGTMILAAACPEGTGSAKYEDWVTRRASLQQVLEDFDQEGFRIGPHKAFQIARDASQVRLLFVSDLVPDFARSLLLNPVATLAEAVEIALTDLPDDAHIGVLPFANSTIPALMVKE